MTEATKPLTKDDLPFLVAAIEKRSPAPRRRLLLADAPEIGTKDKVPNGPMSVPDPVTVDVKGSMTVDDYKKCSTLMAVCQNMVQKSLTAAAKTANVEPDKALKNMNAWLQAYMDFPFPFFNFKDTQSDAYKKDDFVLDVDPEAVEKIVNIKDVAGLKEAVIGALKKSGGTLASYSNTERSFNYFGIITGYNATDISVRIIKFAMNMKQTEVKSLCAGSQKTHLDTLYDTYQFVADKALMIKIQEKMGDQLVEYIAAKLMEFVKSFYEKQLATYEQGLVKVLTAK
jgi:hypothetical protein